MSMKYFPLDEAPEDETVYVRVAGWPSFELYGTRATRPDFWYLGATPEHQTGPGHFQILEWRPMDGPRIQDRLDEIP